MPRPPDSDSGARTRVSYRLPSETRAILAAIADLRGQTQTRVLEDAIEAHGRRVLGRRLADLVPPRVRAGR